MAMCTQVTCHVSGTGFGHRSCQCAHLCPLVVGSRQTLSVSNAHVGQTATHSPSLQGDLSQRPLEGLFPWNIMGTTGARAGVRTSET